MNYFSMAKRDNNPKRNFIIINKFQSKHFPSDPKETINKFSALGKSVKKYVSASDGEKCLVIGFAETAVAVGAFIARELGEKCLFLSTTREKIPSHFPALKFEEAHSHAAEHWLCLAKSELFSHLKTVVIADDEFTTGKTAVNLAKALRNYLPKDCEIIAAAFVSSKESRERFSENMIKLVSERDFSEITQNDFPEKFGFDEKITPVKPDLEINENSVFDFRNGVLCGDFFEEQEKMLDDILSKIGSISGTVHIIGTEENCVLPILIGERLAAEGAAVTVQGATRSPMLPSDRADYPIKSRTKLKSLYDENRTVFLYNSSACDTAIVLTDAENPSDKAVCELCGASLGKRIIFIRQKNCTVPTSLKSEDCRLLLKNITGKIKPLDAKERGALIKSGVHYCELLPAEYEPSDEYIAQYEQGLERWSKITARAVAAVAERIYSEKGEKAVIVSLARAGTPIGALIVRYIRKKYGINFAHYSVSIIRGRGIDRNALRYILARHSPEKIQFVDGWTGKGAINKQLKEALFDFCGISDELAVLADPAGVCSICGTHEDIFIPCSCLNSVVSGLFSRTVLREDLIGEYDFHGAAFFEELKNTDRTYEFIDRIEREMNYTEKAALPKNIKPFQGLDETKKIAEEFGVTDLNLVKPGIGETTRVLLRRIPKIVLINEKNSVYTAHIEQLAREKNVPVTEYPLKCYRAVGIIEGGEN